MSTIKCNCWIIVETDDFIFQSGCDMNSDVDVDPIDAIRLL